eukprot:CAMPEP_0194339372 /NCGR_PEP_ID=MMETSP0171-20130528/82845_1 /TAXON_ID=218684 /ORGANISM="Corethron pennatum, Strain L29A3" /LENGTH=56 /DNA_ID=CAMNT_0039103897 /DNA_START=1 /DNA_END=171 /DNA_ORIENTATION=+
MDVAALVPDPVSFFIFSPIAVEGITGQPHAATATSCVFSQPSLYAPYLDWRKGTLV